ncbi:hypothetical protein EDC04DRAFT_2639007, partial [Pisolithus marmoratus]
SRHYIASKTVTEKVAEVADKVPLCVNHIKSSPLTFPLHQVNKKVGKGLASAIETGERATEKTKETLGSSTETAERKAGSAKQTVQEKTESAKRTGSERFESAKKSTGEAVEESKRRADEVSDMSPWM